MRWSGSIDMMIVCALATRRVARKSRRRGHLLHRQPGINAVRGERVLFIVGRHAVTKRAGVGTSTPLFASISIFRR